LHTAVGAGFISLRDDKKISSDNATEKDFKEFMKYLIKG